MQNILSLQSEDAWAAIRKLTIAKPSIVDSLEDIIAGSAWDLWETFHADNPFAVDFITQFYETNNSGAAVLILDALSLRELPELAKQAESREFCLLESGVLATVLPADTTTFAKALGFDSRSDLEKGKMSKLLPNVYTFSSELPFFDCEIKPEVKIMYWHHFPDSILHNAKNLVTFNEKLKTQLTSDDFWQFVNKLLQGRTLLITSDHGYADTTNFSYIENNSQGNAMKQIYGQQRFKPINNTSTNLIQSIPPLELQLGNYRYTLGRRKWRVSGGYPCLQHSGLTLMECFTPYIILTK
ncbi:MAG: hypothetical protein LBH59_09390 [Planctomycetaceae bacterium]|jgi:hypothetical protein|nr:hypothetical protein [Planctomycetaceae bacterium]